jgi:oligopeptide transport system ATP-binding protein
MDPLLTVRDLCVRFDTPDGIVHAVDAVDLDIAAGECLAVVGESGSGKSQLFLALLGALTARGRASGSALYKGIDLLKCPRATLDTMRGREIGLVWQDPLAALTPHLTIGSQITEVLAHHRGLHGTEARTRARELLERVRIADAARRLEQFPHELSGGMRQRVMIAIAIACDPRLLIADEPTSALDVTVQAEILALLRELQRESGLTIVLITHDFGVVAEMATRVAVMYAGTIVEVAAVERILVTPRHPYTAALCAATPGLDTPLERDLAAIAGQPPQSRTPAIGCAFAPRCARALARCRAETPSLSSDAAGQRSYACYYPLPAQQDA